jgi:hypothetical protein
VLVRQLRLPGLPAPAHAGTRDDAERRRVLVVFNATGAPRLARVLLAGLLAGLLALDPLALDPLALDPLAAFLVLLAVPARTFLGLLFRERRGLGLRLALLGLGFGRRGPASGSARASVRLCDPGAGSRPGMTAGLDLLVR